MEYHEWFAEALPVLGYIKEERDREPYGSVDFLDWDKPAEALGMDSRRVWLSLEALYGDGLIAAATMSPPDHGSPPTLMNVRITPAGLRELGAWPRREASPEVFLEVIDRLIASASAEDRNKLGHFREAARGLSVELLGNVIKGVTAWAMGQTFGS